MRHVFATTLFFLLGAMFLSHLWPVSSSAIVGGGEDTRLFLWNAWWFYHAAAELHTNPYFTSLLFAPFGVSLVSHDFPLWNNLLSLLLQTLKLRLLPTVNLTFYLTWCLSGIATYMLAWEVTRARTAAIVAGVYVMTNSYTLARTIQNWGQLNLYGIALFLWSFLRARRTGARRDAVLAGFFLAWCAACHFYFFIYSMSVWLAVTVHDAWPYYHHVGWTQEQFRRRYGHVAMIVASVAGALALWITLAHPASRTIAGVWIGLESPANAWLVCWVCVGLAALAGAHEEHEQRNVHPSAKLAMTSWITLCVALVLLSPLLWSTARLTMHGDFPRQSIMWKTHLPGANLLAPLTPNPLQAWWGPTVKAWLVRHDIHPEEQASAIGWIALVVMGLSGVWRRVPRARRWLALALAATVFSMGVYLHVGPYNTWIPLPFYVLRLLPVFSNVRVPERWMALGAVAWSVVLAFAICALADKWKRSVVAVSFLVGAGVLIENWPGLPIAPVPPDQSVYERLRQSGSSGVLPLPFYVGDSSIGAGNAVPGRFNFPWDHLWAQRYHGQPIAGGYIGRLPRRLIHAYQDDPFFGALIRIEESGQGEPPDPANACRAMTTYHLQHLLVYPAETPSAAWTYVGNSVPLRSLGSDDGIELYEFDRTRCPR